MPFVLKAEDTPPRPDPIPLTPPEKEIQKVIKTSTGDLQSAVGTNAVGKAIAARNIERVVEAFPWDATAQTINASAATFGQVITDNIGQGFPKVGFGSRFDFTDPRSIAYAKAQAAQLVTAVSDSTRKIIRETIADAFNSGITVKETARRLRSVIGLNDRQTISMRKFQDGLTSRVASKELTIGQAEKMLERQYKKMINYRADLIARQEIIMAENHGRYLGFQQSVEQGWADPKSVKRWSTSTDERTCDICLPMNGKSVQWNQSYPNGVFNPPAHILCRCSISLLEPDSRLAQSFMPPAKPAPPVIDIVMPLLPTAPVGNLRTPQDAIDSAFAENGKGSVFQYDAGEIEGLNVHTERVIFNGSPHTELRFKETDTAKTLLFQRIERSVARDNGEWSKQEYELLDRKRNGEVKFSTYDPQTPGNKLFEFVETTGTTYTRYYPNGVAVRIVKSQSQGFALDSQIRVMIPGKATPAQIREVMKDLGLAANRLPSQADIDLLRDNQILALFNQADKKATGALRASRLKGLEKKYGFSLSEVTTEVDSVGRLRFILPDKVTKAIIKETDKPLLLHDFNNTVSRYGGTQEKTAYVVNLIRSGRLQSTTERYNGGVLGNGLSEGRDIATGGADYVFFVPQKTGTLTTGGGRNTIVYKSDDLLKRTDWFAYAEDSYGVKNPKMNGYYMGKSSKTNELDKVNYIEELKLAQGSGEVMFLQGVDLNNVDAIYLGGAVREEVIKQLRSSGMIMWFDGRELEAVLRLSKYDLDP